MEAGLPHEKLEAALQQAGAHSSKPERRLPLCAPVEGEEPQRRRLLLHPAPQPQPLGRLKVAAVGHAGVGPGVPQHVELLQRGAGCLKGSLAGMQ